MPSVFTGPGFHDDDVKEGDLLQLADGRTFICTGIRYEGQKRKLDWTLLTSVNVPNVNTQESLQNIPNGMLQGQQIPKGVHPHPYNDLLDAITQQEIKNAGLNDKLDRLRGSLSPIWEEQRRAEEAKRRAQEEANRRFQEQVQASARAREQREEARRLAAAEAAKPKPKPLPPVTPGNNPTTGPRGRKFDFD